MTQVKVYSSQGTVDKKAKEVAVAQVPVYESLAEIVQAMGEEVVLHLANTQNGTNLRNQARQAATGRPSTKQMTTEAFNNLLVSGKLQALAGDLPAISAAVDAEVARLKAEQGPATEVTADE
jgi:hypothetical protein